MIADITLTGRPPYGYKIEEGKLQPHPIHSMQVRAVFELVRAGATKSEVARAMRKDPRWRRIFFDRKKVSRILTHAAIYCLGRVGAKQSDHLIILPPKWLDTAQAFQPPSALNPQGTP